MTGEEILIEYHAHRAFTGEAANEVANEHFARDVEAWLKDDSEEA